MKKEKVVLVTEKGARVYTNPSSINYLRQFGKVFINPSLARVRGIAPEFWTCDGNKIIPKTRQEIDYSLSVIDRTIPKTYIYPNFTSYYINDGDRGYRFMHEYNKKVFTIFCINLIIFSVLLISYIWR